MEEEDFNEKKGEETHARDVFLRKGDEATRMCLLERERERERALFRRFLPSWISSGKERV